MAEYSFPAATHEPEAGEDVVASAARALLDAIRAEPMPPSLVALARDLQAALDSRNCAEG